jgi:predicted transcriptional regulator
MLGESELTALEALREPTTVSGLADRLGHSQSYVSEVVDNLADKGLVRKERNGREKRIIPSESKAVELYLDLSQRYSHIDFPEVLSGPTIPLLYYLDEPTSVAQLAERTDNYRNTVNRRVKLLRDRGIIRKDGTRHRLNGEFHDLNRFAREYIHHVHRQRASKVMDGYTILWEDHESFLVQTDRQVSDDSVLTTGPERFEEYGLPLLVTETRYYFYSAEQIEFSPEELVCHMLLIDSGTRFRSYCLLLLTSVDVNDELLKSRATHYGVFELVEQLLEYLETRGESTAEPLPSWDEFQALAEEYEVPV